MSLDTSEKRGRFTRKKTSAIESGEQVRLEKINPRLQNTSVGGLESWPARRFGQSFWHLTSPESLDLQVSVRSHEYSPSEVGLQVLHCHFSRTSFCGSAFLFIVSSESHATYIPTSSAKNRLQGGVKGSLTRTGHSPGFCLESWW